MVNLRTQKQYFISVVCFSSDFQKEFWVDQINHLCTYLSHQYVDFEIIIIEVKGHLLSEEEISFGLKDNICTRYLKSRAVISKNEAYILALNCCIGEYIFFFNPTADSLDLINETINFCMINKKDIVFFYRKFFCYDIGFCFSRKGSLAVLSISVFNLSIMKSVRIANDFKLTEFKTTGLSVNRFLRKAHWYVIDIIFLFKKRQISFFSAEEICSPQMINLNRVNVIGNFEL